MCPQTLDNTLQKVRLLFQRQTTVTSPVSSLGHTFTVSLRLGEQLVSVCRHVSVIHSNYSEYSVKGFDNRLYHINTTGRNLKQICT